MLLGQTQEKSAVPRCQRLPAGAVRTGDRAWPRTGDLPAFPAGWRRCCSTEEDTECQVAGRGAGWG